LRTTGEWQSAKLLDGVSSLPIGLAGMTLRSKNPQASLIFRSNATTDDPGNFFTKATLFHSKDKNAWPFEFQDSQGNRIDSILPTAYGNWDFMTVVDLSNPQYEIVLRAHPERDKPGFVEFYGLMLENGQSGILYNMVGIGGTAFKHLTARQISSGSGKRYSRTS
jgi:hypothetical protein